MKVFANENCKITCRKFMPLTWEILVAHILNNTKSMACSIQINFNSRSTTKKPVFVLTFKSEINWSLISVFLGLFHNSILASSLSSVCCYYF